MTTPSPDAGTEQNTRPAEKLMHDLLEANAIYLARATTPGLDGNLFIAQGMASHYAAAAAWLLNALDVTTDAADEAAAELSELLKLGEPLIDWAGEQHDAFGIDADEIIERLRRP